METKGFLFNDDLPFGEFLAITRVGDPVQVMLEFAKCTSCLGPDEFLAQASKRPSLEVMEIVVEVYNAYQKRVREAGDAIAKRYAQ